MNLKVDNPNIYTRKFKMQRSISDSVLVLFLLHIVHADSHLIDGIFTEPKLQLGYNLVTNIPKGATYLNVTELRHTANYLALRLQNGSFVINGNYNINRSGEYKAAGTSFVYQRQSAQHLESFTAQGPLSETVSVMVLYQEPNPGIVYRYVVPPSALPVKSISHGPVATKSSYLHQNNFHSKKVTNASIFEGEFRREPPKRFRHRKFAWKVVGLTECSRQCGGGFQTMKYACVREHNQQQVPQKRCHALERPTPVQLLCNVDLCNAKWKGGPWSECSVTCGQGTRVRDLECVHVTDRAAIKVSEEDCAEPKTLPTVEVCTMQMCENYSKPLRHSLVSPKWNAGTWSQCSATCGYGQRFRNVSCPTENLCDIDKKPVSQEACDLGPCPAQPSNFRSDHDLDNGWLFTEWSEQCSSDCGTGVQTRRVTCNEHRSNGTCNESNKPETSRDCSSDQDCSGQWFIGPWSRCSSGCSLGEQIRDVVCVTLLRGSLRVVLDMNCPAVKPETRKSCRGPPCSPDWFMSDWSQCSKSCGSGVQNRQVLCLNPDGQPSECDENNKPISLRICNDFPCRPFSSATDYPVENNENHRVIQIQDDSEISNGISVDPLCTNKISNCHFVTQARLCRYQFYEESCCLSCATKKFESN